MPDRDRGKTAHRWLLPAIAVIIIVLDQVTKLLIRAGMVPGESIPVFGPFALTYVQNTGSAFGLFPGQGLVISILGVFSTILILVFYRYLAPFSVFALVSISMVFGGAVGNLVDRFALGYVTDFIDVRLWGTFHWPFFNVADSCITIGGLMLVYYFLGMLRRGEQRGANRGA